MSLIIDSLHSHIAEKDVLKGISLTVQPGEIHAIMGPNGSGKSTLAYTLAGHPAYEVDTVKSRVELDGENLMELSPDERAKQGVFLAFQYPTEIPGVSVQNFLRALWEARFGPLKDNPEKSFDSVLAFRRYLQAEAEKLGVAPELLQRNLNEGFSGGERKRVEILQMSLFKPRYAILDETDSGLDIDAIRIVAEGAKHIVETHDTGVLLITHYQRILQFIEPDFVHVLVNGQIVKSGEKELAQELENTGYEPYLTQ
ncbi:Fe-S cluster assembly ATPase SufC [Candidatus Woesebacteria bacterium]|nr:Fe-S cluster assembly ATPase SufC [Candidatus Woesebacteria bacterium]MCD8507239.1 Fe-S cluster assembly ATPase SufC [Candidatus Woesebacteria bacterium]MCD8526626.1 Fe-S cluster assembly ATPase SufC [Candidatus Woesebacteria bacterium]MCD8546023.1 Fe-S cluster assembly ATPase SufC [Candidatus Woesebacteria bacterium]